MTDIINEEENTDSLPEEEQESVVVDNGQTYASSETAVIAQQAAEQAKLWAQESERQANLSTASSTTAVDARDDAIAAKEYAEAAITDTNLITVATDLQSTPSNIKIVAQNIEGIRDIAENIDTVLDAKNQAIAAANSASSASQSATSASNSATVASTSASQAASSASSASTSATSAGNSATSASGSATTATTQAGIATTKAGEASTSASNAASSASNASQSATAASGSATAAAQSETNALNYKNEAKQYAVGLPTEPEEKSAKWWAEHSGLPDQTGQSGKVLMTDGLGTYWGQSAADGDGITINTNNQGKTQAIGVINQNNTSVAIKTWTGTKAQYEALKVTHTMYEWKDNETGLSLVYTESLQLYGNDPVYDSSYNIIGRVISRGELVEDVFIVLDDDVMYTRLAADDSTTTIYENRINANTLYNITDDTDVSLTILEALYPVGSVYITTASGCPLSALISGSTWELVSSGRVLQGADNDHAAGTTIEAGLPNITSGEWNSECVWPTATGGGAVVLGQNNLSTPDRAIPTGGTATGYAYYSFDASQSNSIYGNSTTVQPPAYIVNIFRRTA